MDKVLDALSSILPDIKYIGVGTGRTVTALIPLIKPLVTEGHIFVPTSYDTEFQLIMHKLPYISLMGTNTIDIYIDGADFIEDRLEGFDGKLNSFSEDKLNNFSEDKLNNSKEDKPNNFNEDKPNNSSDDRSNNSKEKIRVIKGNGGALTSEKIMLGLGNLTFLIIQEHKFVRNIKNCKIPIEIVPAAMGYLNSTVLKGKFREYLREGSGKKGPVLTDLGHFIIDVPYNIFIRIDGWKEMAGVVETGLFLIKKDKLRVFKIKK